MVWSACLRHVWCYSYRLRLLKLLSGQHLPACSGLCSACAGLLSGVLLFATLWTVARQVPLSMDFSEYWSGLPFLPPRDLPAPGVKPAFPASPTLQVHCCG